MIRFPQPIADGPPGARHALLGLGVDRIDGRSKVSGAAHYAAEFHAEGLLYGCIVSSAIARGRIASVDSGAAEAVAGVVKIFDHRVRESLAWFDRKWKDEDAPYGSPFRPLHDEEIVFSQQPIALIVAETFEAARQAAALYRVEYESESCETDLREAQATAREPHKGKGGYQPPPAPRGDADSALAGATVKLALEYTTPVEHHNPMELFASTVIVEDGKYTVYDKTQGVSNSQTYLVKVFGLKKDDVTVRSPFVGGGFGSGLRPQYQLFLAMLAARDLQRSVTVSMTRQQMFTLGHRPPTIHRVSLGAEQDGTLTSIIHECESETSRFEDYVEVVVNWSAQLYQCENVRVAYNVVPLDVHTPLDMRAPGAALGVYALESAIDELAHALRMDPVALRLKNYAERDQTKDKPYSSKELRACFTQGARRFGWDRRSMQPGAVSEGRSKIGMGMACGVWDAMQQPASARATLRSDGTLLIATGTSDIGTGTYTVLAQIAADTLGLPLAAVTVELADSSLPSAPLQGGSWTVSSVGTAVKGACDQVAAQIVKLAHKLRPEFKGADGDEIVFEDGRLRLANGAPASVGIAELMRAADVGDITKEVKALPNLVRQHGYTVSTHSAVFVEVAVDEDFGTVQVRRVVSAIAGGRIINEKTARSQIMGAVVWGIGMALHEESVMDHTIGRYMNHSFAEYHIPVHADIPTDIDVIFVEEHDDVVNPLGAKGLGEIGIVGVAAAVANAVFNATGKRVRDLPITLDKVIG